MEFLVIVKIKLIDIIFVDFNVCMGKNLFCFNLDVECIKFVVCFWNVNIL